MQKGDGSMTRLQQTDAVAKFGLMTEREIAILQHGYGAGINTANNAAFVTLGDLQLRIDTATDLNRKAIEALYTPSF